MAMKLNLSCDASQWGFSPESVPTRITRLIDGELVDFYLQHSLPPAGSGPIQGWRYETLDGCINYPGDSGRPTGNVLTLFNR